MYTATGGKTPAHPASSSQEKPPRVKACLRCRKKVKCNGEFPCETCKKSRNASSCTFAPARERQGLLQKRESCFSCRRKKRRCDAKRPLCGTCEASGRDECVYETTSLDHRRFQRQSDGVVVEVDPVVRYTSDGSNSTGLSSPDSAPNSSSPVHVDDPHSFAVSDVSLNDLNMIFRLMFLSRNMIVGIYLPWVKRQAVLRGDTSSLDVHPFYIHYANLVGCQLYQERLGAYSLLPIQAVHLVSTLEALESMDELGDPLAIAQANSLIGSAFGYANALRKAKGFLRKSVEIVRRNNVRFVEIQSGEAAQQRLDIRSSPELLEQVHERAVVLAQMVHVEILSYLIGQQPSTMGLNYDAENTSEMNNFYLDVYLNEGHSIELSDDLEKQFRYELPDAYPLLFEICPILLRVRSTILSKDAINLTAWSQQQSTLSDSYISTCQTYLSNLVAHITDLTTRLAGEKEMQDSEARLSLRYGLIVSWTNFAQIHSRNACTRGLRQVVRLVEELDPCEFLSFEGLLGVTWTRALALFTDERQAPLSTSETPECPSEPLESLSCLWSALPSLNNTDESGLETNISRLAQLSEEFYKNRFLEGTHTLCAQLSRLNATRSPHQRRDDT